MSSWKVLEAKSSILALIYCYFASINNCARTQVVDMRMRKEKEKLERV